VDQLEREEDLELETFKVGADKLVIVTVEPDRNKLDKDIALPQLTPILARKKTLAEEIAALDVAAMSCPPLPRKQNDATARNFHYEGYDIITLEKLVERDYTIPEAQTAEEVISYYSKRIAQDVKLPSQFANLVPKVREFLETCAFGQRVDLADPVIVKAISTPVAQYVTVKAFAGALRALVVEEQTPELMGGGRRLSETPPFPFSRPTLPARKTVFNLVACDNDFERKFAHFLEAAPDVVRFAKIPSQLGFAVEYTDAASNLRYYEPDFVVVDAKGVCSLVETKGREDVDVAHKDRAAQIWCENATLLTGAEWRYLKVPQKEFEKLQPEELAELTYLAPAFSPAERALRDSPNGVAQLIARGESDTLEFKSSARWDMKENRRNPVMEKVIVKTVAGFLNYANGGTLLIGVADDGTVVGLDHDLQTLKNKQDLDGYELFLTNLLLGTFGKDAGQYIRITFPSTADRVVCQVEVKPSERPIFVKDEKGEQFYARVGDQTVPLSPQEMWNYCRVRWK
jgi:hypothetical protein